MRHKRRVPFTPISTRFIRAETVAYDILSLQRAKRERAKQENCGKK